MGSSCEVNDFKPHRCLRGPAFMLLILSAFTAVSADFTDLFDHTTNKVLSGHDDQLIGGITPEECAQKCLEGTSTVPEGGCLSFDYRKVSGGRCQLSRDNKDTAGQALDYYSQFDHYEMKDIVGFFAEHADQSLGQHDDVIVTPPTVSPRTCALRCLLGEGSLSVGSCLSFDLDSRPARCLLSRDNQNTAGQSLYFNSRFDHYQRTEFCFPNPCIHGSCTNQANGFSCTCDSGWEGDTCDTDINECSTNGGRGPCGQVCSNTVGSYTCSCNDGYSLDTDGHTCSDINECSTNGGRGPCGQVCTNTAGSYICSCNPGYSLDTGGHICNDINECSTNGGRGPCAQVCSNTVGSYTCSCNPGYSLDTNGHTCSDIDECLDNVGLGPCSHTCTNTEGSYTCSCNDGYSLNADEHTCDDINECSTNGGRGPCAHVCTNAPAGSYTCSCNPGYSLDTDRHSCSDIDECADNTNNCDRQHATCTNTVGSFTCACISGYYGDGRTCTACGQCAGDAACNTVTGVCSSCQPPWTGQLCQQIPAEVTSDPEDVTQSLNLAAVFTCTGRGEPIPTVTWQHDGSTVTGGVSMTTNDAQHTFTSTLSFSSVQRADNGQYTCTAANGVRTDTSQPATLTVLERPEAITVTVTSYTSAEIQATVTVGFTGNLAITAIQVRYKQTGGSSWTSWTSVDFTGTQGSFDITGLTPATDYMGEVRAQNDEGWSDAVQFTWRTRDAPSGPPSDLQAPSTSSHSITLTWQEPAVPNGVITHYSIQYGQTTECSDAQLSHMFNTTDSSTSKEFPGLIPYTTYSFRVRAYTSAGPGDYTGCVTARTTEYFPTKPTSAELADMNSCNCETANQHRIIELQARWRRPHHVYGELRGYYLQLLQQNLVIYEHNITQGLENDELNYVLSGNDVAGLNPAQRYYIMVSAYNDVYIGEVTTSAESLTSAGCPTAPFISKKTLEDMCAVNWTEPSGDRGNITGYSVTVSATKLGTDTPAEPVMTSEVSDLTWTRSFVDLPAYSLVHVTVRAKTCAEGEASEEITCTVQRIDPPDVIPNVTVDDSSVTSSSFQVVLPDISQRNGPISCYQVIIVPMRKDETFDDLTMRVGQPQEVLTASAPEDGRTEPYIALAYSGTSYKDEIVTIGTGESCTDPCCRVGSEEGAQDPGNRLLSPGSTYTATVRAYVDLNGQGYQHERTASLAQISSFFIQPIITVLEETLPLVTIIIAVVAAVVASFAAGAGFMFYRRKYINSKKDNRTTDRNDVPLSDITSKEDTDVEGTDNEALTISEGESKCYRTLSEIRTVDDVTQYLKENNFGEYVKAFRDHDVDGDALKYLDDVILKDLIPKAGPRARFKGILAEFKQEKPSQVSQVTNLNFWEIPRTGLKLGKRLGSGQFGEVRLGELRNRGLTTTVAVKTLRDSASEQDKKDLLGELEILVTVGRHDNIISLVGACTGDGPLMIVVEYAPNGCLKDWLKTNSVENNTDSAYQNQPVYASQLSMEQLIQFGVDVASGMSHLAAMQCVHRDLAARNILLGDNLVAKVSDFGLSRDIYEDSEYVKTTKSKLPLRWMAYESLFYNVYTTQSDIWSFGVLLWEIMAMGNLPYEGMKGKRMMDMIKDGGRLEKPSNCPAEIYTLMTRCWETLPEDRPTFPELRSSLIRIMQGFKTYASLLK